MKKQLFFWVTVFSFCFSLGYSQNAVPGCVDGEIYLKYKPGTVVKYKTPMDINPMAMPGMKSLVGKYGVTAAQKPFYQAIDSKDLQLVYKVAFSNIHDVENLINDLSSHPSIEYAEKVPLCVTSYTTNDPQGPTFSTNQWFLNTIGAQNAWNVFNSTSNGTSTITVAVVDNAIARTHPDLSANIWTNPGEIASNNIDDDGNGYVDDVNGYDVGDNDNSVLPPNTSWSHGTHCSGIVGARNDNSVGISSIGHNVKIIPVKATANSAGSNAVTNGYGGIVYAARCNAKVISLSWGGTVSSITDQSVINYAWGRGCIIIAAAANDGNNVLHYPAAYTNVYAVANTTQTDTKNSSSCYGTWVDISAPGTSIYSTIPNTGYGNLTGTSMACPLVAGLAGLMLSKNAYMTPTQVLNCISSTAANIYTIAANSTYAPNQLGAGRIQAYQAMLCASVTPGSAPTADFYSDIQSTCPGQPIKFFDISTLYPTSWSWTFQGGTPATSTVKNPTVTYAAAGTYSVGLTVNNPYGAGSVTKIAYITITNPGSLPLVEGFQGAAWPPAGWVNDNKFQDSVKWERATNAGGFGTSSASALFDNYYHDASGIRDGLMAPKLNFGTVSNARLRFDVAYSRYDATYSDTLEVKISTNCGNTWTSVYMKGGTALSTAPDYTVDLWVPTSTQWRRDSIDISTVVAGQGNVLIDFVNHGHYGQGIYLDNVNLAYTVSALPPVANYNYPSSICTGASITFTDVSTNAPTSWSWNMPGASVSTSTLQNPTVTYNTAGVYNVTLTATNGSGSNNTIKTFTVYTTPTVTTGGTSALCTGNSGTITASGATTYTWQPGGLTGASVVVTPTANITYTVTGVNGTCAGNNTKVITVTPTPTVSVNTSSICSGQTATLTASGATTYSWNTGATTNVINPSPTSTTIYSVTGTTSGCSQTRTTSVTVSTTPTVAVNTATICSGNSVNLTASGATTYSWNTGATTSSISVTPATTTNYTVTGANGTCVNTRTTTVIVNITPTVSVNNPTICIGNTTTLTASGATTYSWNTGATTNSIVVTPASTTVYTITGTNTGGCTNVRTSTVTVAPAPTVAVNAATICAGSSVNLIATGAASYTWNTGATTSSIAVSPTVNTTYTVTGANGTCVNTRTTSVNVNALPSVSLAASSSTACTASTGGINVTLTGSPSGGVFSGAGVSGGTFTVQPTAGTYTATYTFTNSTTGCSNSAATNILVSVCTGVGEVNLLDGNINLFPNPNAGIFTIQANMENAFDVTIYNNIGQLVYSKNALKGANEINLSEFGRGIYNVVIKLDTDYKTIKVIIE